VFLFVGEEGRRKVRRVVLHRGSVAAIGEAEKEEKTLSGGLSIKCPCGAEYVAVLQNGGVFYPESYCVENTWERKREGVRKGGQERAKHAWKKHLVHFKCPRPSQ